MDKESRVIYLIAGEPSGDLIGAHLITALREESSTPIKFHGVGGGDMKSMGFNSLFPIEELSVMGLMEILPHIPRILRRISEVCIDIKNCEPDVIITIDSPSFSVRVAKRMANFNIPKVHYVAPTVWAWRPWRVKKFKRYFDHLLAILPFEPAYFEAVNLPTHFVGHPVTEYGVTNANGVTFRRRHRLANDEIVVGVLPGSRLGEVSRHIDIFKNAVYEICKQLREVTIVIPTLENLEEYIRNSIQTTESSPRIIIVRNEEKYEAMAACNVAIAASGTVALELAIAKVPSVIAYRTNPITAYVIRHLIRVDFANILNILAGREIIPECIQEECNVDNLSAILLRLLSIDGPSQVKNITPYVTQLHGPNNSPSKTAAQYILNEVI